MPYGSIYDPAQPYDGIERGLLGYLINSNIENQSEFVLSQRGNDSAFIGAVRLYPKSKDPTIGTQYPAESIFVIPQPDGAPSIKLTGLTRFVTTKAAACCFLPSETTIKFRCFITLLMNSRQPGLRVLAVHCRRVSFMC